MCATNLTAQEGRAGNAPDRVFRGVWRKLWVGQIPWLMSFIYQWNEKNEGCKIIYEIVQAFIYFRHSFIFHWFRSCIFVWELAFHLALPFLSHPESKQCFCIQLSKNYHRWFTLRRGQTGTVALLRQFQLHRPRVFQAITESSTRWLLWGAAFANFQSEF